MHPSTRCFDPGNRPTSTLLTVMNLVADTPFPSDATPASINAFAQKNLLRHKERWNKQTDRFEPLKPDLLPLLCKLGFVEEASARLRSYTGAIIHGGTLSCLRVRIAYLAKQYNRGVRFPLIYCLTGDRLLDPERENPDTWADDTRLPLKKGLVASTPFPKTERELAAFLWELSDIAEPLRKIPIHFVQTPMQYDPKTKTLVRPTTDDTIRTWLQSSPPKGHYMSVSDNPYIPRHTALLEQLTPDGYTFEGVGAAAEECEQACIFLDELARLIFTYQQDRQHL